MAGNPVHVINIPHIYRVGHKSLDTFLRFKCIFVKRLMAHPVYIYIISRASCSPHKKLNLLVQELQSISLQETHVSVSFDVVLTSHRSPSRIIHCKCYRNNFPNRLLTLSDMSSKLRTSFTTVTFMGKRAGTPLVPPSPQVPIVGNL
jgi:hypothetical protein